MIKEFYTSGAIKAMISEDFKIARVFEESGNELEAIIRKIKENGKIEIIVYGYNGSGVYSGTLMQVAKNNT